MPAPTADEPIRWLLDGDPSVRWQTLRDLVHASERTVARERSRVARQGWGARLLREQDASGTWGGGLYTPKWTSTTYTMLLLRDLGLPPDNRQAGRACRLLLDRGVQPDGGISFGFCIGSETCVTGMILSIAAFFRCDDPRLRGIADHLLDAQMSDGGWNCERPRGATHGSMHTTISVLEGLRLLELQGGAGVRALHSAQQRGREFLLVHRLFRSHRTGNLIKSEFTRFVFPPRWHYDVLRALDYFQAVGAPRDPRLSEAINLVRMRRRPDGRWPLPSGYKGRTYFELERTGAASRWNTLRALRVLKWWEQE